MHYGLHEAHRLPAGLLSPEHLTRSLHLLTGACDPGTYSGCSALQPPDSLLKILNQSCLFSFSSTNTKAFRPCVLSTHGTKGLSLTYQRLPRCHPYCQEHTSCLFLTSHPYDMGYDPVTFTTGSESGKILHCTGSHHPPAL